MSLTLQLLGSIKLVGADGTEARFRSQRVAALLIYLASQDRPVSRAFLAELIWPDKEARQGRNNLRWGLTQLNKLIPGHVEATRQTVALQPSATLTIDTHQLAAALDGTDHARLAAAAEPVEGIFCDGFSLDAGSEFDLWLLGERAMWQQRLQAVFERLTLNMQQLGDGQAAVEWVRRLLGIEPWREDAHRLLMLLLAEQGRDQEALAQFARCRQLLSDELGVEPDTATTQLRDRIARRVQSPQNKLPHFHTPFVGRTAELSHIEMRLASSDARLVTILGIGGTGKTRLAVAAAERLQSRYLDGVLFVVLVGVTDVDQLIEAIVDAAIEAGAFGIDSARPALPQLIAHWREHAPLLVLDNYEQLLPHVETLLTLLEQTAVTMIVTSRERLNVRWEFVVEPAGFPLPRADDTDVEWQQTPSVALFLEAIRRQQPSLTIDQKTRQVIDQICQTTYGLPLALELAASWASYLKLSDIAKQLAGNVQSLVGHTRDFPPRQQGLRHIFNSLWLRLPSSQQNTLAALSRFPQDFDPKAAEAIAEITASDLISLRNMSLLQMVSQPNENSTRYLLHPLVAEFAMGKLSELHLFMQQVEQRFVSHFAQEMEHHKIGLVRGAGESMHETRKELLNFNAAWELACQKLDVDALQSLQNITVYYNKCGQPNRWIRALELALNSLPPTIGDDPPLLNLAASLHVQYARLNPALSRNESSAAFEQAIDYFDRAGSARHLAAAKYAWGATLYPEDLDAAHELLKEAYHELIAVDDVDTAFLVLENLRQTARTFGEADVWLHEAQKIEQQLDGEYGKLLLEYLFDLNEWTLGQMGTVDAHAARFMAYCRANHQLSFQVEIYEQLFHIAVVDNDIDACRHIAESFRVAVVDSDALLYRCLIDFFELWLEAAGGQFQMDTEVAIDLLEPLLAINQPWTALNCWFLAGVGALNAGNYQAVEQLSAHALSITNLQSRANVMQRHNFHMLLAELAHRQSNAERTEFHLEAALHEAIRCGGQIGWLRYSARQKLPQPRHLLDQLNESIQQLPVRLQEAIQEWYSKSGRQ